MLEASVQIDYPGLQINAEFAVPPGTGIAIMGPSGAGKSSVLNAIAGFVPTATTNIVFDGRPLHQLPPHERPLSILFQAHNLFAHLNVWENISIGLNPRLKLNESEQQAVKQSLKNVGLEGYDSRSVTALSGGQQQRVALARCLARARPLLLLDEPFTGLDKARHYALRELINALMVQEQLTLVLSTHDQEDTQFLCQQVREVGSRAIQ